MLLARTTETDPWELTPTPLDPRCARGLMRPAGHKTIPIHMLYEDGGSALYEAIERHPDYYPYQSERALLARHADEIVATLPRHPVLIELGCGDCTKTRLLLDALVRRDGRAHLVGIDSSADALEGTRTRLGRDPRVVFTAIHETFFEGLARAAGRHPGRDLCVLLLGSSLGNMSFEESVLFLRTIVELTTSAPSTRVLLGLDMWKDEDPLRRAYDNDITATFELNGLRNAIRSVDRRHRFDPGDWRYVVEVNPAANQVEMLAEAARPVSFAGQRIARGERILLEVSHKFRESELERLFAGCARVSTYGEGYRLFVLAAGPARADNPWTRYGADDLDDIDDIARIDYAAFIRAYAWSALGADDLALLDVGCGSGAVARMLRADPAGRRFAERVGAYDLLDISANSLRIAEERVPFPVARKYCVGIQDFADSARFAEARAAGYDLVWSIHGVTAVPRADLWRALLTMLRCLRVGGKLLIVVSDHDSHYAAIDRAYLADRAAELGAGRDRFLEAEDVVALVAQHGIDSQVLAVEASHVYPARERESWRRFNAWCVYDQDFDVARGGPATAAYLDACRDPESGGYRLRLSSMAITVERDDLALLRWLALGPGATIPALDGDAYARGCAAFEARSTQRQQIARHLGESGVIAGLAATRDELRVLSLGCGDGVQDQAMLAAALGGFRGVVRYVGVDTSPIQRARCAETLAAAAGRVGQASLAATIRAELARDDARFDCVLMLHLLYYVEDLRATLAAALARLDVGGRLIVWHAPLEAMNQLARVFWGRSAAPIPFADDVERALLELGATFTRQRIDGALRLGPRGGGERDDALSFLIQADSRALDAEVREELEAALERLARADGTLAHPVACFLVERPPEPV